MTSPRQIALVLFSACGVLAFGNPEDYSRWHHRCEQGDGKTIEAYCAKFEQRLRADPQDHLARAYLGSAHTLRAREATWGPSKLSPLDKGKKLMDQAVAAAPDDPRVRTVRAINSYRLPRKLKRRPLALADFKILAPLARNEGGTLSKSERQVILYYAWKTFREEGHLKQAAQWKAACHQIDPHSPMGKEAR